MQEFSQNRKLKRATVAATVIGMSVGMVAVLSSFDDSGGGTGSGGGCSTTSFLYNQYKTQDKALQVECYKCNNVPLSIKAVKDSAGITIGFITTYGREKAYVTRRDCKSSPMQYDQCNEISVTNVDPDCSVFTAGSGSGSGAGL